VSAAGANSDAELGARVLAGWERMTRTVPDGPRHNRRLAERFGVQVREVEHLRDIRNRVAHPGERISRQDLERAVAIVKRSGSATTRSRPARTGTPRSRPSRPSRSGSRSARPGSAQARRSAARTRTVAKARKAKRQLVALAAVLAVLAVVVVVLLSVR
jgi:hypothetical protein